MRKATLEPRPNREKCPGEREQTLRLGFNQMGTGESKRTVKTAMTIVVTINAFDDRNFKRRGASAFSTRVP